MDFNKLVKSIIGPTLLPFKFTVGKEIRGIIEYEHELVKFLFSYDYSSSYEVNISLAFNESNIFYDYNQIKVLFCNKDLDPSACQMKEEEAMVRWLQAIKKELNENLDQILSNSAEVKNKLEQIRQLQVNSYQQEEETKILNNAVEKYWSSKDYSALVSFVENNNKPVDGSIKMKYEYAVKKINV